MAVQQASPRLGIKFGHECCAAAGKCRIEFDPAAATWNEIYNGNGFSACGCRVKFDSAPAAWNEVVRGALSRSRRVKDRIRSYAHRLE